MIKPTCEDLYNEDGFKSVHREIEDGYKTGHGVYEVFMRESDGTYWAVWYRAGSDYNGLGEGEADIEQVEKKERVITETFFEKIKD